MRQLTTATGWMRQRAAFACRALPCLVALLVASAAHAGLPETPRPDQLSVADGLPSNIVFDLAEDARGYLWFATIDGLARYDGAGFRVWRREDGLGDNEADCIFVDADDSVWVGTDAGGISVIAPDRRHVRRVDAFGGVRLDASPVWDIVRSGDGAMWIGTAGAGLYRAGRDGSVAHFLPRADDPRSLPGPVVTELLIAGDGTLWVATNEGVARWTGRDFERVPRQAMRTNYVQGIIADRDGSLWMRSVPGGNVFRKDGSWSLQPWRIAERPTVYGPLLQDRDGAFWLNTSNGLVMADRDDSRLVPMYSNLTRGMVRPQFERAMVDSGGGLWFTSQDAGVWHLPSNWRQFSVLTRSDSDDSVALGYSADPASLGNRQAYAAAASAGGDMWLVGTSGVLDRLDPESGKVYHAWISAPRRVLTSVFEDAAGKVWIGYSDGLARFDPATRAMRHWALEDGADAALGDDLAAIAQDGAGLIWTWSINSGVQARTPEGHVVETVLLDGRRGLGPSLGVNQLRRGPGGAMWLAGNQGLLAWDARAERFAPVPGAPGGAVDGFDRDKDGVLWLARFGAVEAYRLENGRLRLSKRFDAAAGVPQIAFKGITADGRGILWVASNRGLMRLDPQRAAVRMYGIEDGLPGQEILFAPVPRVRDGRLLVGASHGVVVFDPAVVHPSDTPPRLAIDSISVRRAASAVQLPTDAEFRIENDDRDLHISARLLSYDNVSGNRYRFRLAGFDDDWVETGNSGERTFSRLAPGRYTLEVQGRTADGLWSRSKVVAFAVAPPWWRTWWAIALFAALAALLVLAAAASYRRRVKRRSAWQLAEHKRELAEQASLAKTRFLATLGHEVRTPMTGVLGMAELLLATNLDERQRGYTATIQNAGAHLLRLVNDALDLARIEAGKLELDEQDFDLRELVAGVVALVAPMARQRGLRFDEGIDAAAPRALRGDPLRVRQILLNLLNNAIKFTERGGVGLRVLAREGGGVRFLVSDTGPGISAEQQARLFQRFEQADGARTAARYGGSGLGLAICQELALAMGGRIDMDSAPGKGTRFIVDLPLAAAEAGTATEAPAPAAPPSATASLRILLVEDDATIAEVMVGLLRAQGHRVVHVAHGLAALTEAAERGFDLAMLDLDLPGLDGLALARQLRAQGFVAPMLAVTARADGEAEPAAREAGCDGFLRKPVTGAMLARAIESVLGDAGPPD